MAFNTFFTEMILPFLLVFVVVFAVLQKTKILGDGKKQIDSMAALVIGLLAIGLPVSREFITAFMPWLAVGLAVLIVFFILYGFVAGDLTKMPQGFKVTFGILAGLFTLGVLVYVTGFWKLIVSWFGNPGDYSWFSIVMILLVAGAVIWVVMSGGEKKKKED